jgi:hypothetical protein
MSSVNTFLKNRAVRRMIQSAGTTGYEAIRRRGRWKLNKSIELVAVPFEILGIARSPERSPPFI